MHDKNSIKWTRSVKKDLSKNKKYKFQESHIIESLYRPFVKRKLYFKQELNEMQYQMRNVFGEKNNFENKVISFVTGKRLELAVMVAYNTPPNLNIFVLDPSQNLPLYRYKDGKRIDNITDWSLEQFKNNYKLEITKEDIFHYTYAVFHNPNYKKKYAINLKREFPRLPFYKDFFRWVNWGKELMDLHINYEKADIFKLKIEIEELKIKPKAKLKIDKINNHIIIDENTTITGVPKLAFEYKLGNRSAIEWILNQYKEKKSKDKTITEKFSL